MMVNNHVEKTLKKVFHSEDDGHALIRLWAQQTAQIDFNFRNTIVPKEQCFAFGKFSHSEWKVPYEAYQHVLSELLRKLSLKDKFKD